jgi:hypothetical protein
MRPRQQKHTQAELASMVGVSVKSLREWKKNEGLDLGDLEAVKRRAGVVAGNDKSIAAIRKRKLELECERIEAAIRRESVGYIRTERASQIIHAFAAVAKSMCNSIAGNLPGMLEGATPAQIHKALDEAHHNMFSTLSNTELCENHPEMKRCLAEMERLDRKNLCHECRKPKDADHED